MEEKKNNAVEKVENIIAEKHGDEKKAEKEKKAAERRVEAAREKQREKAQKERIKEQKKEMKDEQKKSGKKNSKGLVAAVITLGIATLVLASALTFTMIMPSEKDMALENVYQKSFYDTVSQVDNMDLNMSKILATEDEGAMQEYLMDLAVNSELAENDLQQLPIKDESKFYTTKLVNQIGDFAKYLNKKIIDGSPLNDEDYSNLLNLYEANKNFKNSLQNVIDNMGDDFEFSSLGENNNNNLLLNEFTELENLSVEYPELIYDGPFSDAVNEREVKGLSGGQISESEGMDIFKSIFGEYNPENVTSSGETNAYIECYTYTATVKGESLYAEISKNGGRVVMFAYAGSCKGVNYEERAAIERAVAFMEKTEINGMKPVWSNLANNVYTINFAFDLDGIIVYSDIVKVRVCAETGMVIGLEATAYYTNHTERVIDSPAISEEQAKAKVSSNIEIETCRLSLVPIGEKSEKLCYEISGNYDGSLYYVYIDAKSGRQIEMFKVIEGTEGKLLM